ncbi:MAG: hypothetical protein GC161_16950 [Planctomycetaceae bacterium]|nr:hypothetical protein [Planctomycetaceae bacterium]
MSSSRRLMGALVALALVVLVLAFVPRPETPGAGKEHAVRRLVPEERSKGWSVAALTVARRGERPFLYGRQGGQWRCLSHAKALVAGGAMESLLQALLDGQMSPRGASADAATYGLDGVPALRLELHGPGVLSNPDRDVLFTLDVGHHIQGLGTSFVRMPGQDGIFALELDLVERLASEPGQPPLLERWLLPSDWSGRTVGVNQVVVERPGGRGIALVRESVSAVGAAGGEGEWRWRLERFESSGIRDAEEGLAQLYVAFLFRASFDGLLEGSDVDPELAKQPEARITVYPVDGSPPVEMALLAPLADGRRVVLQARDRLVLEIAPNLAEVLAAEYDQLIDPVAAPPWDRWIKLDFESTGLPR